MIVLAIINYHASFDQGLIEKALNIMKKTPNIKREAPSIME